MKLIINIALAFIVCINGLSAQKKIENSESEFDRAEKIFSKVYKEAKNESLVYARGGYADALPIFLDLYKKDTTNMDIAFKIGVCYQNTRRYKSQ